MGDLTSIQVSIDVLTLTQCTVIETYSVYS